ncbi:hypothetical protein FHX74_003749 [Friedmanniella endophytica]|uniref:Peptidase M50B-like n=1 Tax=Microlunatus kandeliicorticis TaxID=1759536 RepID=A0A7W3P7K1_9ACTN|nr:hypothetical protein [Microlunatus kandeliicorticis]MBA8796108.1 hypothetical protein [Microlunatus kandeliicorticis]
MTDPTADRAASSAPLFANAVTAFVLAASVAVTLHETAHALAGLVMGSPVRLLSFAAGALGPLDAEQDAVMAAAGPLFSLVLGLVVLALTGRAGRGFGRLFWLWLGFVSTMNFVGYLIITPFGAGDTGEIVRDLRLGTPVAALMCAVGVLAFVGLSLLFVRRLGRYATDDGAMRRLGLIPWLAGTAFVVVRTLVELAIGGADGTTAATVAAGAAACGVFAPVFSTRWRRLADGHETLALRRPIGWAVLAAVVVVLQLAVLAPGVRLG